MVKEPRPGRVKTRLGRDIGMTNAAWWFRHQTKKLIRELQDPRWRLVLAVSPDKEGLESRIWPNSVARFPQGNGDLGARMGRIFKKLKGPTIIIGADIPNVSKGDISAAFDALGSSRSVIGPAPDGGYWLIGLNLLGPPPRSLFDGVRWSTKFARQDTKKGLPHPISEVSKKRDVDSIDDLAALKHAFG